MKFLVVGFALAAVASAQERRGYPPFGTEDDYLFKNIERRPDGQQHVYRPESGPLARIVGLRNRLNPDGSYTYGYGTDGNIHYVWEDGVVQASGSEKEPVLHVRGGYRYVAPNNVLITVDYRAGEEGFDPTINFSGPYNPNGVLPRFDVKPTTRRPALTPVKPPVKPGVFSTVFSTAKPPLYPSALLRQGR